jgi:hypothetical protein
MREGPKEHDGGHIVGGGGLDLSGERSQVIALTSDLDLRSPGSGVTWPPRNAPVLGYSSTWGAIRVVLRSVAQPQVRSSVVQRIPVLVVDRHPGWCADDDTVHVRNPPAPLETSSIVDPGAALVCKPAVLGQSLVIDFIDEGSQTASK